MSKFVGRAIPVLFFTAAISGCTSASVPDLPDPPKVKEPPSSTSLPDYSSAELVRVDGTTTTAPVQMQPGDASLFGRVLGPGGPAGGAKVRVERFVDDQSASTEVTAAADGAWRLDGILGGRYRVRAFRPPDAAQTEGQVVFVNAGEKRALDLQLESFGSGLFLSSYIAPAAPVLGTTASVVVSATTAGVDNSGVARSFPASNIPLQLITAGGKAILSSNPVPTNAAGRAQWQVRCDSLAAQGMSVALPDGSQRPVNVAACVPPPPVLVPAVPTPTAPPTTTSTTSPTIPPRR